MGRDKLPTVRGGSTGLDVPCEGLDVDHCFDGWDGAVHLRDELLHTTIRSTLGRLVVFTNATRDFVAIEPVSHVNNAINLVAAGADAAALGLVVLQPGESMSAQMTIEAQAAKA
jgi:aldose 1-epimerase